MLLRFKGILATLVGLFGSSAQLPAAEPDPSAPAAEQVATLTAEYREERPFGALAVGVIQNGKAEAFGFGSIEPNGEQKAVDGRTMFEIGSCTKVFTSLSLAVLVARGEVTLDSTVGQLLPDADLSADAAAITLKELSTHTSGLPRIPLALFFDAIFKGDNPYKDFTAARLLDVLKSWKAPAHKRAIYSNMGAGLLGYVLQQKAGAADYEALIAATATEPLGLKDTVVTLSEEQRARYAVGHTKAGKKVSNWDFQSLAGGGALRSNVDDLLKFLNEQLHPEVSLLKEAIELTQQKQLEGEAGSAGLGWQISQRGRRTLIWHNGGTGGYRSFMGIDREAGVAVVLLSNTGDAFANDNRLDQFGFALLKSLADGGR